MPRGVNGCQLGAVGLCTVIGLASVLLLGDLGVAASQSSSKAEAEAVRLARSAVAAKPGNGSGALQVVGVAPAQWRDASLGCPEQGLVYAAMLTSGYEVRLRGSDREHVVHVGGGRAVVCDSREETKVSSTPMLSASLKAAEATKTALSTRLEIRPTNVRVVSTRPATASTRESCVAAPATAVGPAFIVEARANGTTYRYYSDAVVTVSCNAK